VRLAYQLPRCRRRVPPVWRFVADTVTVPGTDRHRNPGLACGREPVEAISLTISDHHDGQSLRPSLAVGGPRVHPALAFVVGRGALPTGMAPASVCRVARPDVLVDQSERRPIVGHDQCEMNVQPLMRRRTERTRLGRGAMTRPVTFGGIRRRQHA